MIGELSRIAIHSINTHPIAIAVSADQAYFQIVRRNFSNRSLIHSSHDARLDKRSALRVRPPYAPCRPPGLRSSLEACRTALLSLLFLPQRCCSRQSGNGVPRWLVHDCPLSAVTAASLAGNLDPPFVFVYSLQNNFHIPLAHESWKLLSPLDQQDVGRPHQIIEPHRFQFSLRIHAVELDVVGGGPRSPILVDESEGGAGDIIGRSRPEAFGNPFHQRCLASS